MSQRESEIAAKIEMLRRQQKLKSQKARKRDSNATDTTAGDPSNSGTGDADGSEKDEGFFLSMIEEGESLFGTSPTVLTKPTMPTAPTAPNEGDETGEDRDDGKTKLHKPKVSTWGVYPRPENISRAYGGGKKIPVGGVSTRKSEESRKEDARVRERLAKYRGGTTAEAEREAEHLDEIKAALAQADSLMRRARESEATRLLRTVVDYTTVKSRLGGEVRLALALALEGSGRRSEAKALYGTLLRENQFNEIRQKVKRLSAGFADMEKMKMTANDTDTGFRSIDFTIPDISAYIDKRVIKRYKEEVMEMTPEEKRAEALLIACVFGGLLGIPALVLFVAKLSV